MEKAEDRSSLKQKIAADLASAQCLHQLDLELSRLSDGDWRVFVTTTEAGLAETTITDPETARFRRALLASYRQRRRYLQGENADAEEDA
jgi:hypothetical protein